MLGPKEVFRYSTSVRRKRPRLTKEPARINTTPRLISVIPSVRRAEPMSPKMPSRTAKRIAIPPANKKTPIAIMSTQTGLPPPGALRYSRKLLFSDDNFAFADESPRFIVPPPTIRGLARFEWVDHVLKGESAEL